MYSMKNFHNFGIQRAIFSITTMVFGITTFLSQEKIKGLFTVWVIWIVINSYERFFNYIEKQQMPLPSLYCSKVPRILSFLGTAIIFYFFFLTMFKNYF
jgi:hypothetical protein